MDETVVWVKGYVPTTRAKLQYPYAEVSIPVSVRVADPSEATLAARVTTAGNRPQDAWTFDVLELDGRLWRPIRHTPHWNEGRRPTAEEMLVRTEPDNPLAKAARRFCRQTADTTSEEAKKAQPDPAAVETLREEMAMAADGVRIIGGVACRECAEPTWIVTPARFGDMGVLLQPFFGFPGRTGDAAWFSVGRLGHARAYAAEMAAARGCDVLERGGIETMLLAPSFDDVRFAEDRLIEAFAHAVRALDGTIPEEIMDLAREARLAETSDRALAVSLSLRACDALAGLGDRPDVAALMEASAAARAQVSYFSRNAVFSDADDSVLDGLSLPSR